MVRPDGRASARNILVLLVMGTVAGLLCSASSADVPQMINYQGKLTTASGGCLNDTVQMIFTIYFDSLATIIEWMEVQPQVIVKEGVFSVLLGSAGSPIPASIFDGGIKYLGVQVGSDPEMRPLKPMVSAAYACRSLESDTAEYARAAPVVPDADWTFSGNDIFRVAGNVGIGAPPTGLLRLEVLGNLAPSYEGTGVRGSKQPSASYRFGDGHENTGFSSPEPYQIAVITCGFERMRINNGGNVGIGTPSPGEKLEVVGNIHASGSITSGTSLTIDGTNDKITATSGTIDFDDENLVTTGKATIGPGHTNAGVYAFVAGQNNTTAGWNSTVGGGRDNMAGLDGSTVGGGVYDTASGIYSTVSGGAINVASGQHSTVAGGNVNLASGNYSTVGGGEYGTASGTCSTVPGGLSNTASGYSSFAAGMRAKANHHGTFVWADSTGPDFASTGSNQFLIRASGGVGIGTTSPQGALDVNSTTGAFIVPRMTTAQRDALTAVNGMIIYNTSTNQFNFYENGAWVTK